MPTISGYADGEPIEAVDINQYFLRGNRNAIINGDMRVGQRANFSSLTSIADGAYGLDRWVALGSGTGGVGSSGQNVNVQQMTDAPTGGLNSMRLMATTNNLKFGCVQIIENRNIAGIRSGTVTVSFKAKDSAGITDVRCAVLGWSSTADSVTRDIISTSGTPWLSSPPTLAANWSYLNTPANLNVTNSWADYRVNANVVGNPNNIAVFIWVNSTTHTTSDDLLITDVQLESGAIATPFERKTFQEELANCQRYFARRTNLSANESFGDMLAGFSTIRSFGTTYSPQVLRVRPTITQANCRIVTANAALTASNITTMVEYSSDGTRISLDIGTGAGGTVANQLYFLGMNGSSAFIQFDAEM